MASNSNLQNAKTNKQDEFYTLLPEIQAELNNYTDKFKKQVVFCNCDDPFESNFVKYFLMNFNRLGLKELIATGYSTSPIRGTEVDVMDEAYALRVSSTKKYLIGTQKDLDAAGAKYFLEAEKDRIATRLMGNLALGEDGSPIQETIKEKYIDEKGKTKTRTIKKDVYYEAGDFRSDMSIELLKESTIVVTNPPFSLFREYVVQLMNYEKKFLIIGNQNAITYKEIFPLIKDNKMWLGVSIHSGDREFNIPPYYEVRSKSLRVDEQGKRYVRVVGVRWFTNLDHYQRHQLLPLDLGYKYYEHEEDYPKYDNYDAINVDKTIQIPCDYEPCWYKCSEAPACIYAQTDGSENKALCEQACNGEMGVPITYMDKHCPEQFEIIGADFDLAKPMSEIAQEGEYQKGGPAFYVQKDLTSESLDGILPQKRRSAEAQKRRSAIPASLQADCHSSAAINAMESLECLSPSSINIARNNSELLGCQQEISEDLRALSPKQEKMVHISQGSLNMDESLSRKCNGVIGVPITFLDKYCPEQFIIIGFWNAGTAGEIIGASECKALSAGREITWNGPTINGKTKYFRILIKRKAQND